jgi:hypothetical protein
MRIRRLRTFLVLLLGTIGPVAVGSELQGPLTPVNCTSTPGERQHCSANTSAGVLMKASTGSAACLLGKTWGYDDAGVWVLDGCGGEFLVVGPAPAKQLADSTVDEPTTQPPSNAIPAKSPDKEKEAEASSEIASSADHRSPVHEDLAKAAYQPRPTWGTFTPGDGFLVGRSELGELSISGYALLRYLDQRPAEGTFLDHLGREHTWDGRRDFYSHRVLVFLKGWLADPKLVYNIAWWTVNTTDQDALFGNLGYQFHERFNLYGGINGNPGTRSMQGSHPYWLGHDRVMADEFFRPFFSMGVWANGELFPGFWYNAMVGNNSSVLGTTASDLDRKFTTGASIWWMPTTHEFGPKGAFGDWEMHDKLATRLGISTTFSPEQRYQDPEESPLNTSIKLADSLNVFDTGALAPGVTVEGVDYKILSVDAGLKYMGFFLQTEFYTRWLDNFIANGMVPVDEIVDQGFYIQTAFFPVPKKLELYAATSQIYGDEDAGFGNSHEYLIGLNWYPFNTRNHRLNVQFIDVTRSPVGSTFGYYTGGQSGQTGSVAFSVYF